MPTKSRLFSLCKCEEVAFSLYSGLLAAKSTRLQSTKTNPCSCPQRGKNICSGARDAELTRTERIDIYVQRQRNARYLLETTSIDWSFELCPSEYDYIQPPLQQLQAAPILGPPRSKIKDWLVLSEVGHASCTKQLAQPHLPQHQVGSRCQSSCFHGLVCFLEGFAGS